MAAWGQGLQFLRLVRVDQADFSPRPDVRVAGRTQTPGDVLHQREIWHRRRAVTTGVNSGTVVLSNGLPVRTASDRGSDLLKHVKTPAAEQLAAANPEVQPSEVLTQLLCLRDGLRLSALTSVPPLANNTWLAGSLLRVPMSVRVSLPSLSSGGMPGR